MSRSLRAPWQDPPRRPVSTWAWPAGLAVTGALWYASDSLRHRREQGHGYQLRGEAIDPRELEFLRRRRGADGGRRSRVATTSSC